MKTIHQIYHINAPVTAVWRALVDPISIDEWGGGPAIMADKKGSQFKLWGGEIHGTNIEVVAKKKLVQHWYSRKWAEPSLTTFELKKEGRGTRLIFTHENIPDKSYKEIESGWREYYLGPLQGFVEQQEEENSKSEVRSFKGNPNT